MVALISSIDVLPIRFLTGFYQPFLCSVIFVGSDSRFELGLVATNGTLINGVSGANYLRELIQQKFTALTTPVNGSIHTDSETGQQKF